MDLASSSGPEEVWREPPPKCFWKMRLDGDIAITPESHHPRGSMVAEKRQYSTSHVRPSPFRPSTRLRSLTRIRRA
jgi:hypothetical protein